MQDNPNILEVILPLGEIPDDSLVRKISGEKLFTVTRQLRIFSEDPTKSQIIKCEDGSAFLTSCDNIGGEINISTYSYNKKLVWIVDKQQFYIFLTQSLD